ncbi:hypothetical protein Tco_0560544 [Tanacetum coccineum]
MRLSLRRGKTKWKGLSLLLLAYKQSNRSGNINRTQSMATLNEPSPHGTGSGSGPRCQDTILGDTEAQTRVLDLKITKTSQAKEIASLKKRVKKLERKRKSKTLGMNLFKIGSDFDEEFDANMDKAIEQVYDANKDTIKEGEVQVPTADIETLVKMRSEKSKVRWLFKQEKPLKKKDQIKFDEEIAQRLQAQMQAELEEEERLEREREEDANITEWDNVQAMIDADYELAARLQAQE